MIGRRADPRVATLAVVALVLLAGGGLYLARSEQVPMGRNRLLDFFGLRPPWSVEALGRPWSERPAIYAHVASHVPPEGAGLLPGGEELPDEKSRSDDDPIRWAPGALDGISGHHMSAEQSEAVVAELERELAGLSRHTEASRFQRVYEISSTQNALSYLDELAPRLAARRDLHARRLAELARWMAREAPDREAVKLAISLVGLTGDESDLGLLLTLGRHDEFTLYAAVAILRTQGDPERALWRLARSVEGWGRVHVVERLAETEDPQIREWLLLEGYQNSIMLEYTALICAQTGDLLGALRADEPSVSVLDAAADLLGALVRRGGPAAGIEAYPEGVEAVERFLLHVGDRRPSLHQLEGVAAIASFARDEDGDWNASGLESWTERRRNEIAGRASEILASPQAREAVSEGLASDDPTSFHVAMTIAPRVGIDPWEATFARLERGEDLWYHVMQTDREDRIDRVIALAERVLPLAEIASGADRSLGLGPEYRDHSKLDFVLQDLRRFPGRGWPLIRAGLQSPVIRNRHMAIRALAAWSRSDWPPEAEHAIRRGLAEPDDEVKAALQELLAG